MPQDKIEINTVIFDLGGVLIDWQPRRAYRKIFKTELAIDYFLKNITTSDWNEKQDAGRPIQEANEILVTEYPEYEEEILAYYGQWEADMLGDAIEGTVDILNRCLNNNRQRVLALTNWSDETFPIALDKFDFLHKFEGILVSGKEKMKKPDPAIYELILSRYNLDREKCVFIDDSQKNVDGAKNVGIHAIRFSNPQQLERELVELEVL